MADPMGFNFFGGALPPSAPINQQNPNLAETHYFDPAPMVGSPTLNVSGPPQGLDFGMNFGANVGGLNPNTAFDMGGFNAGEYLSKVNEGLGSVPTYRDEQGMSHAAGADMIFPELFGADFSQKMGNAMNPNGSGLGMDLGAGGFNMAYQQMMGARMSQPFVSYDSEGKKIEGASMSDFLLSLKGGNHGEDKRNTSFFS